MYQCPRLSHCIIFYRHWLVAFFSMIQAVKKRRSACRFSSFYLLFAFTIVFVTSITSTFSSIRHNSFVSSFYISSGSTFIETISSYKIASASAFFVGIPQLLRNDFKYWKDFAIFFTPYPFFHSPKIIRLYQINYTKI